MGWKKSSAQPVAFESLDVRVLFALPNTFLIDQDTTGLDLSGDNVIRLTDFKTLSDTRYSARVWIDGVVVFDKAVGYTTMGTGWGGNAAIFEVNAGPGNDVIDLSAFNGSTNSIATCELFGGDGNDTIYGGNTVDKIYGGNGDDFEYGMANSDNFDGGAGNDWCEGGSGDDYMYVYDGSDYLGGGPGNDTVVARQYSGSGTTLTGGDGNDIIVNESNTTCYMEGGQGNDNLAGGNAAEQLFGGAGNDTFTGGGGADSLYGNEGADSFFCTDGIADAKIWGGPDDDSAWFDLGLDEPALNSIKSFYPQ